MKTRYAEAEYGKVTLKTKELAQHGPGQLLLQAEYSSISPGTEYGLIAGKMMPLPQQIGYSMVATVIEVGEGVTDYQAGDLVVATGPHAEYLVLDQQGVTPAPKDIDKEQAAFFILGHTVLYGIRRTQIQLGEAVVVLGQGMVGAIAAQLARLAGACPVIVTDIDDQRLEFSKAMGVQYAINTKSQPDELARVIDSLGTGGVPVVFEAAGVNEPMELAFKIVGERGRVFILSTVNENTHKDLKYQEILINLFMKGAVLYGGYVNSKPFSLKRHNLGFTDKWPPAVEKQALRFTSSDIWTSDEDIRVFLDLIKYGALNIKPLISHRFSPDEITKAYDLVWKKDPSLVGGIIRWK